MCGWVGVCVCAVTSVHHCNPLMTIINGKPLVRPYTVIHVFILSIHQCISVFQGQYSPGLSLRLANPELCHDADEHLLTLAIMLGKA